MNPRPFGENLLDAYGLSRVNRPENQPRQNRESPEKPPRDHTDDPSLFCLSFSAYAAVTRGFVNSVKRSTYNCSRYVCLRRQSFEVGH